MRWCTLCSLGIQPRLRLSRLLLLPLSSPPFAGPSSGRSQRLPLHPGTTHAASASLTPVKGGTPPGAEVATPSDERHGRGERPRASGPGAQPPGGGGGARGGQPAQGGPVLAGHGGAPQQAPGPPPPPPPATCAVACQGDQLEGGGWGGGLGTHHRDPGTPRLCPRLSLSVGGPTPPHPTPLRPHHRAGARPPSRDVGRESRPPRPLPEAGQAAAGTGCCSAAFHSTRR